MFHLTMEETNSLRPESATRGRGHHVKHPPHAFTEEGVAMLSTVLKSPQAIQVNIAIMRAFVKLRETLAVQTDLAVKLGELERRIAGHDEDIRNVFDAIRELMAPPARRVRRIGFRP